MTLQVKIFDKITNQVIDTDDYPILLDDFLDDALHKLFAFGDGIERYPPFLKCEVKQNGQFIQIKENRQLLQFITSSNEDPALYITNLLAIVDDLVDVSVLYIQIGSVDFDNTLERLVADYPQLVKEDLEFIVKLSLLKLDSSVYANLTDDVREYINIISEKKSSEADKWVEYYTGLNTYYETLSGLRRQDYSEILGEGEKVELSNLSVAIRGQNVEDGVRGKYINLKHIFNMITLDSDLPFIAISKRAIGYKSSVGEGNTDGEGETEDTGDSPLVKIYDRITDFVTTKEVKSWILNEKKKLNQITYKKVKGLMLKYRIDEQILTVNLHENGMIYAKLISTADRTYTADVAMELVKKAVDSVINKLNALSGVFRQSKRIDNIQNSVIRIESLTGHKITGHLIRRDTFTSILNNNAIREYLFELKDTLTPDLLSFVYRRNVGDAEDTRTITVNIKDNPYKMDSSVIVIYGTENYNQLDVILKQIVVVSKMSDGDATVAKQKLKERSQIKELRKRGMVILSTKCQKPRQPAIDQMMIPIGDSYALDYNGKRYVCPKSDYPYPGFTNENIVCCFKKDQRSRDTYLRNVKTVDMDVMVQPSNFRVTITNFETGKTSDVHVIKVVSEYLEGLGPQNAMGRYYYIDSANHLVQIKNDQVIREIELREEDDIWLETVPLTRVITAPPKNKCNFTPNMNAKSDDNINAPCAAYPKNNYFGYNLNAYPCCFDKERQVEVIKKKKVSDITKQHIITSDKILDYQRLGVLPLGLEKLFNKIVPGILDTSNTALGKFYRMGVVQNKSAFLNAILLGLESAIEGVSNSSDFRKYIADYLNTNRHLFVKLNGGEIALRYATIENFMDMILNKDVTAKPSELLHLLQIILNINFYIINIPYKMTETSKMWDYSQMRLMCNPTKTSVEGNNIVLLRRDNTYEIVVYIQESPNKIQYLYPNDSKVISFLSTYHNESCIRENVFPKNFPFLESFAVEDLVNYLKDSEHQIIAQIINRFNKVEYIMTKKGVILPTQDSPIVQIAGIKTIRMAPIVGNEKLLNYQEYKIGLNQINNHLSKMGVLPKPISILGVTTSRDNKTNGIFTNFGQFVPIKPEPVDALLGSDAKVLDIKYYPDINDKLFSEKVGDNAETRWNNSQKLLKDWIYKVKLQLGPVLSRSDTLREQITQINTKHNMPREDKIAEIVKILETIEIKEVVDKATTQFILHVIANDILNDNIENLLLNNIVTSDVIDRNEIQKRELESVLLNVDDVLRWSKERVDI